MKTKLFDCVKLVHNDSDCVILEVKENKRLDLFKTGCLDGNEKMFRITKDKDKIGYSIIHDNGSVCNWNTWTLVSDKLRKIQRLMSSTIVWDFGIPVCGTKTELSKFNNIKSDTDDIKQSHYFEFAGWNENEMQIRKDHCHIGCTSFTDVMNYLKDRYEVVGEVSKGRSPQTNCLVYCVYTFPKTKK